MKLKWPALNYGSFVYGTKLYSAEAKKFMEQMVNAYNYQYRATHEFYATRVPYSYLLNKCEIIEADDGEILLNGVDETNRYARKAKVDDSKFKTYINSFFARFVDDNLKTIKNCNSETVVTINCRQTFNFWTESIPLWQIFLMRDLANGVSKDILYKHFSKERVESFVGTQKNTFIVELRKEYTEKENALIEEEKTKREKAYSVFCQKKAELEKELRIEYDGELKKIEEEFKLRKEKLNEERNLMETNLSSGD